MNLYIKNLYRKIFALFFLIAMGYMQDTYSMNLMNLYDTLILPDKAECSRYQLYAIAQTGFSPKCYDECGCVKNALRIWNKDQNSLKMLEGLSTETQIGQFRTHLDANDDGTRGHFSVCGDFEMDFAGDLGGWFYFNKEFFLSLQLPVYSMKLKNVSWTDLTQGVSVDDLRVKNYLTNNFAQNVKELGCLDICGWKRAGVGDLALIFGWAGDFPQAKKTLKNVKINARTGLTVPTGKKADEDKIFAFAFGADGAVAPFLGAGLDLTFGSFTRAGLDVQILYPLGNTKCRRIKTNTCQTDLLFLTKTETYKSSGLKQRFNLYLEFYGGGFSFKPGYQFLKKGEDSLYICSNKFFDDIANTAESLQEITMHNIVIDLSYHFWTNRGISRSQECLKSCAGKCSCDSCSGDSCSGDSCSGDEKSCSSKCKSGDESSCSQDCCKSSFDADSCGCKDCCDCKDCCGKNKKNKRFDCCACEHRFHPYIGLFAKIPFNGTRAATESSVGLTLGVDF